MILIVEDDPDVADATRAVLSAEGYEVQRAAHGRQALQWLTDGLRPEVILLDLMMPIMGGRQMLEVMKQEPELATIPVVIVSAAAKSADIKGVPGLQKPFSLRELLSAIERVSA